MYVCPAVSLSLTQAECVVSLSTRLSVIEIHNTHVLEKKKKKHGNITTRSFRDERNNPRAKTTYKLVQFSAGHMF